MWIALLLGFALTTLLCLAALRFFPRIGLMDTPERYGLLRAPIPYYGGLTVYASCVILALIVVPMSKQLLGLLAGMSLVTFVAFLDDAYRLPAWVRLIAQAGAGCLLVLSGVELSSVTSPFGGSLPLVADAFTVTFGGYSIDLIADSLTVVWVVLLINALNWCDGISGQASGIAVIAAGTLLLLSLRTGFHYFDQSAVILLSALFLGSTLAFTLWNIPPPKILLGDTGSMLMGFMIAALALFGGSKIATAAIVTLVPIADLLRVTIERMLRGTSPLKGDYSHLHHRLLAAGLSKRQTVALLYLISGICGGLALTLSDITLKLLAFSAAAGGIAYLGYRLRGHHLAEDKG